MNVFYESTFFFYALEIVFLPIYYTQFISMLQNPKRLIGFLTSDFS